MPVHLYGQCADMDRLVDDRRRGTASPSSRTPRRPTAPGSATESAGSWGIGCFSLYATKNLTTGEGGLITTDDDALADRLRVLRNQGMRQRYEYEMAGNNYRLTDLQAALCLPQLATYGRQVAARQAQRRGV